MIIEDTYPYLIFQVPAGFKIVTSFTLKLIKLVIAISPPGQIL
jgi:hypothetical protein